MKPRDDPERQALIYQVADMFLHEGVRAKDVAAALKISREEVYPLLSKARDLEFIRLVPPIKKQMAEEIAKKFNHPTESIRVVDVPDKRLGEAVAADAAILALELIKRVARQKTTPVGLGIGPGRASLDFARYLSRLMANDPEAPKLRLVAISAGGPAAYPEYASTSLINLFPGSIVAERVALFAETIVPSKDFTRIKDDVPGVDEAFKCMKNGEIDIVATSMGAADDSHDLLGMFLQKEKKTLAKLKASGWVGNVQFRPYSDRGPIDEQGEEMRAVTLFELKDFVEMSRTKNKHVILIARECGVTDCPNDHSRALRPLLTVPSLKVWSELVVSIATARGLLKQGQDTEKASGSSARSASKRRSSSGGR